MESLAAENELKITLLSNIVIRQEEKIDDLQIKLRDERRMKMKHNVVISGIEENDKETVAELKTKTQSFFKGHYGIERGDPN